MWWKSARGDYMRGVYMNHVTFKVVYSIGNPLFFIEEFPYYSCSTKGLLYIKDIHL